MLIPRTVVLRGIKQERRIELLSLGLVGGPEHEASKELGLSQVNRVFQRGLSREVGRCGGTEKVA